MQIALLNSVSHNLRAPLASITSVLDSLLEDRELLDEATRRELLQSAREEAARLNSLIGNLLDITRLDGGAIHLRVEPSDVGDAIAAALMQLGKWREPASVKIDVPRDFPLAPMDFALITQTLVNLVDNIQRTVDREPTPYRDDPYISFRMVLHEGERWRRVNYRQTITGSVTDPAAAVLPGVRVTMTHLETNLERTFVTDEHGDYTFPLLAVAIVSSAIRWCICW